MGRNALGIALLYLFALLDARKRTGLPIIDLQLRAVNDMVALNYVGAHAGDNVNAHKVAMKFVRQQRRAGAYAIPKNADVKDAVARDYSFAYIMADQEMDSPGRT